MKKIPVFGGRFILKTDKKPACECNAEPKITWTSDKQGEIEPKIVCSECGKEWKK